MTVDFRLKASVSVVCATLSNTYTIFYIYMVDEQEKGGIFTHTHKHLVAHQSQRK